MENKSHELRVAFVDFPPMMMNSCHLFPFLGSKMSCLLPGSCVEVLRLITKHLGIRIKPVILTDDNLGIKVPGGNWTGILGVIASGTVDTACAFMRNTSSRNTDFNLTVPIYKTEVSIAVRRQDDCFWQSMWNLLRVYNVGAWQVILGVFFIILVCGWIVQFVERAMPEVKGQPTFPPTELLWRLMRMHMGQPEEGIQFRTTAGKLLAVVYSLVHITLILGLYKAVVVTLIVRQLPTSPLHGGRDMIKQVAAGRYKLIARDWYFDEPEIMNWFHTGLRKAMQANPPINYTNYKDALELINQGDHVIAISDDDMLQFRAGNYCDINIFPDSEILKLKAHMAFNKGSPWVPLINQAIHAERFEIARIVRKYNRHVSWSHWHQVCFIDQKLRSAMIYRALGLVPLTGVVVIFLGACLLATALLFLEIAFPTPRAKEERRRRRLSRQLTNTWIARATVTDSHPPLSPSNPRQSIQAVLVGITGKRKQED